MKKLSGEISLEFEHIMHKSMRKSLTVFLAALGCLYASFGVVFGLMQAGLPPVLRSRGVDLAAIGWSFILLIPFGLTFLWSPAIDIIRPTRGAPRVTWIAAMQGIIAFTLFVLSFGESWRPGFLFLAGFVIAVAAATMDLAVDALAASSVPFEVRTVAGGLKVGALSLGSIVGGGMFVALSAQVGWQGTLQAVALLSAIAPIPIILSRSWDQPEVVGVVERPQITSLFRSKLTRRRIAILTVVTTVLVALFSLNRIMLVDLGISVETIGWLVGTASPLCSLVASILSVPIVKRIGSGKGFIVCAAVCIIAATLMMVGTLYGTRSIAIAGAIAVNAGTSGSYVILCATILGWAHGSQPATNYAVFYGASRLVATAILIALTRVVSLFGWPSFYGAAIIAMIVVSMIVQLQPEFSLRSCDRENVRSGD